MGCVCCRRNCRGNPFCLNALGEKSWFKELDESRWHDFDPESERREEVSLHVDSDYNNDCSGVTTVFQVQLSSVDGVNTEHCPRKCLYSLADQIL